MRHLNALAWQVEMDGPVTGARLFHNVGRSAAGRAILLQAPRR